MKKILLVTDAWHPQINGPVRVIDSLLPELEKRGYQCVLAHPGLCRNVSMPLYSEIKLALFPARVLRKLLHSETFAAVHIMTEGPMGWSMRRLCRQRGIPFTSWYHTHFQLYIDLYIGARLGIFFKPVMYMLRRFHNAAARTMVSTEGLKRELEKQGFSNVVMVPLGVDATHFTRNPAPPLTPLPSPVFVFFSRLAKEKSPEEFLKLNLPGTKLVIGDGPARKKLEQRYRDTLFVGYKRHQELVDWLSLCDVLVFSCRTETFGLAVLEALACGIPVAAHPVMGPDDIIDSGVDGVLSDDLGKAAIDCLAIDRSKCREKALRYSWGKSADYFVKNLYEG